MNLENISRLKKLEILHHHISKLEKLTTVVKKVVLNHLLLFFVQKQIW